MNDERKEREREREREREPPPSFISSVSFYKDAFAAPGDIFMECLSALGHLLLLRAAQEEEEESYFFRPSFRNTY